MSEHQQVGRQVSTRTDEQSEALTQPTVTSHGQQHDEGLDALLDEIDGLLETNASEYVRSFVQKGGE